MSPGARTAFRTGITTALAFLGALGTALVDGSISPVEGVAIATATVTAAGAWLGIGYSSQSEPFFGPAGDPVEVPVERIQPV